jgi:hypothetical protein
MLRIRGGRPINLTRTELDTLIRAVQFEADAMTAEAARFRGKRRSSLLAIAEANRVLIAILRAEWGELYHLKINCRAVGKLQKIIPSIVARSCALRTMPALGQKVPIPGGCLLR